MTGNPSLSIDAVALITGIHKDILRKWETRYGFPLPLRNSGGFRIYSKVDVEKLLLIKRLMAHGCRPGKIIVMTVDDLTFLLDNKKKQVETEKNCISSFPLLDLLISYCRQGEVSFVKQRLFDELHTFGAEYFLFKVIAPLCDALGNAWALGDIAIHEEHFITEAAIAAIGLANTKLDFNNLPTVLLVTLPDEEHTLGLRMAQLAFRLVGAQCVYLGSHVSIADIINAAHKFNVDICAISVSSAYKAVSLKYNLMLLQANLPLDTQIWIGGKSPIIPHLSPPHLKLTNLESIFEAVASFRLNYTHK